MAEEAFSGLEEKQAADVAVGFGGGARCGELCGAISGAIMTAGLHYSAENRPKADAFDRALTAAFREKFGALRCADLNRQSASGCRVQCTDVSGEGFIEETDQRGSDFERPWHQPGEGDDHDEGEV